MIYSEIKTKVEPEHINIKDLKDLTVTPEHMSLSQLRMFTNFDYIDFNGHEYVDLGLPSGTLWATCNVGANNHWEYGDYFAWGETSPKEKYSWDNYKYRGGGADYPSKYTTNGSNPDRKFILDPEDDAAHINMGGSWRTPGENELYELYNCTDVSFITVNGIAGCRFTSRDDQSKSIFIPAAGYYDCDNNWDDGQLVGVGDNISLWTNCQMSYPWMAGHAIFFDDGLYVFYTSRNSGIQVRGVIDAPSTPLPLIQK